MFLFISIQRFDVGKKRRRKRNKKERTLRRVDKRQKLVIGVIHRFKACIRHVGRNCLSSRWEYEGFLTNLNNCAK